MDLLSDELLSKACISGSSIGWGEGDGGETVDISFLGPDWCKCCELDGNGLICDTIELDGCACGGRMWLIGGLWGAIISVSGEYLCGGNTFSGEEANSIGL